METQDKNCRAKTITFLKRSHQVAKNNGMYLATKETVMSVIYRFHIETGHRGEKTIKQNSDQYTNIPDSLKQQYVRCCEICRDKTLTGNSLECYCSSTVCK